MSHWTRKMMLAAAQGEEFDKSNSLVNVDHHGEVPLKHSTPKSYSRNKEVKKSKDSLNMSNVSGYSLSTSQYEQPEVDNEEEIKKLEHHLQKMFNELTQTREQLTVNEELNEILQQDVLKLHQKLNAEQQINENLRKDKLDNEKLREDLIEAEANIEALKKKVARFQKNISHYENQLEHTEDEKAELERKLRTVTMQKNNCSRELDLVRTELETKEFMLNGFSNSCDKLTQRLVEQQKLIDELQEENEALDYKKTTLEKAAQTKSHSCYHNLDEQLLNDSSPFKTLQECSTLSPLNNCTLDSFHHYSTPPPLAASTQLQIFHQYSTSTLSHLESNLKNAILISQTSTPNKDAVILHFCFNLIGLNSDGEPEAVEENIYFEIKPGNPNDPSGKSANFEITRVLKKDQSEIDLTKFENHTFTLQFQAPLRQHLLHVSDIEYLKKLQEYVVVNATLAKQCQFSKAKIAKLEELLDEIKNKSLDTIQIRVNLDRLQLAKLKGSLGKNVELLVTSMELDGKMSEVTEECNKQETESLVQICESENQALAKVDSRFKVSYTRNNNVQSEIVIFDGTKPIMELIFGKMKHVENNNNGDNINVMIENDVQSKDSSIRKLENDVDIKTSPSKQIKTLEETLHKQISMYNELNENYETLLKSQEELTIEYNNLKLNNEKISEDLHQAIEAHAQKDLLMSQMKRMLEEAQEETTKLNKELAETKENIGTLTKDEIGTIQELGNKNMKLAQTNKEVDQVNDVVNIDFLQLEKEKALTKNFEDLQQKYTLSQLKFKNQSEELTNLQKLYVEVQTENNSNKQEIENLKLKLLKLDRSRSLEKSMSPNKKSSIKSKSYCQLENLIIRLEENLERLNDKYRTEKTKNQQLESRLLSMNESNENLEKIEQLIIEKQKFYDELDMAVTEKTASFNKLHGFQDDLNQSCGETMGKLTKSNRADRPEFSSTGIEDINLPSKENLSIESDSCCKVPSLDVNCLTSDLLREFSLDSRFSGRNLTQEEEKKMTDLLSHLVDNSNTVEKQLELLSGKYHCQYKHMLTLVRDVSNYLTHQNTENAETIVPAYDLLKEIEIQLEELVQNASQVGALICENQELPILVWAMNYISALKRPRKCEWVPKKTKDEYIPKKRSKFCRCITTFSITLFAMAIALSIMLGINYHCRESVPESISCPLDGIFDHVFNGKLPM
ncbi:unnamed protein product [Ceutorhynchus assimilis]|uniref:Uncharacterized protein n=1 Tax=Ceutorhynchus assimilis TaxID=467358 RepID=A0A9N9MCW9_9CUCU|nr:unnamed protein product [Ceutorhynchus assimilis]